MAELYIDSILLISETPMGLLISGKDFTGVNFLKKNRKFETFEI
jgi:hypothetical protein